MKAIYISPEKPAGHARLARRPVREVMSKPPVTVSDTALLEDALTRMIRTGLRHLVVISGNGRCAGILSDRAIAAAWASDFASLSGNVRTAIEEMPAIVNISGTVVDAACLMQTAGVDAVAVVDDDGEALGIITGSDLVALLAQ